MANRSIESADFDLRTREIDEAMAAELSARLQPFADDWTSPEMDIYDDYETNATNLSSR